MTLRGAVYRVAVLNPIEENNRTSYCGLALFPGEMSMRTFEGFSLSAVNYFFGLIKSDHGRANAQFIPFFD
jgi:hypothetical protein